MAQVASLDTAIDALVHDGDIVAIEGSTDLVPFAAAHAVIRAGRRRLTLVRAVPGIVGDQLIGAGCVERLVFAWNGGSGGRLPHRFRDAVENGWPGPLALEEHSHAGMANAYAAGATGLPFAVTRGLPGADLRRHNDRLGLVRCPFTGAELAAVAPIRPDVTIIHAQQADRRGNVLIWGRLGLQKEAALAARRTLVTVEEIVDELEIWPNACVLPSHAVAAVCHMPCGALPSRTPGYHEAGGGFAGAWDEIAGDRAGFRAWLGRHVLGAGNAADAMSDPAAAGAASLVPTGAAATRGASATEGMTVAAARMLENGTTCLVGPGLSSQVAALARLAHAPGLVAIPAWEPAGDGPVAALDDHVGAAESQRYWLQGGRIDVGLLEAGQIDRFGNLNSSMIGGSRTRPARRLPGAGSGPEVLALAGRALILMRHDRRGFVRELDFVTAGGKPDGRRAMTVVTDLGVLVPDVETGELTLTALQPGITIEQVQAATGWPLRVAADVARIGAPTPHERLGLRRLQDRTGGPCGGAGREQGERRQAEAGSPRRCVPLSGSCRPEAPAPGTSSRVRKNVRRGEHF